MIHKRRAFEISIAHDYLMFNSRLCEFLVVKYTSTPRIFRPQHLIADLFCIQILLIF